jgi:hypothetical protein
LVSAGQALFRRYTFDHLVLFPVQVPRLQFLIMLTEEMRPYLVVQDAHYSAAPVHTRVSYAHAAIARFRLMSDHCWSNLLAIKVNANEFLHPKNH